MWRGCATAGAARGCIRRRSRVGRSLSRILLVGQAPGVREPVVGKPFAWTAGKTLFRWFEEATGLTESERARNRFISPPSAAVFPAKRRAEATGCRTRRKSPTALPGSIARSKFCVRGSLFPSENWLSRNSSRSRNWRRSSAANFRVARAGQQVRSHSVAASFRRIALAAHSAGARAPGASPCG